MLDYEYQTISLDKINGFDIAFSKHCVTLFKTFDFKKDMKNKYKRQYHHSYVGISAH